MKIERQQIKGYAYGAIQPSLILRFSDAPSVTDILTIRLAELRESLPSFKDDNRFSADSLLVDLDTAPAIYVIIIDILNHHCGDQRFTPIKLFEEGGALCFAIPTLSPAMSIFNANALQPLLSNMGRCMIHEDIIEFADKQKKQARRFLPAGTNAGNFIAAAAERKIPFNIFNQRYIIFGYGSGSSIFSSSITDQESAIGVTLAKSKVDTNRLLKMSGFPVAEQARVNTVEEAVSFAEKIGYPVVLKPEAEEQGRGVFANIIDKTELKQCFDNASANYKSLILEKFIKGFSYRVHVHHGKVMDVWKMEPASIIGDGNSSIRDIINVRNMTPEHNSINTSLKPIPIDNVTTLNLKKLGLTLSSIPSNGEKIILAATSNESRGGTSQDFLSFLHPQNAELCVQATQTLSLNISGVDLISEDASEPWRTNNTIVCEVNSQPQFGDLKHGSHLYNDIIERIPPNVTSIKLGVSKKFKQNSVNIFNKAVSKIIIQCTPMYLLSHGSPAQYFDEISFEDDVSVEERQKLDSMVIKVLPIPFL
jgi:D-alanine-D-alanine ligase-like ATP-grasp enzyme